MRTHNNETCTIRLPSFPRSCMTCSLLTLPSETGKVAPGARMASNAGAPLLRLPPTKLKTLK
ncbi:unnamed protein product [Nesidiocoris tenuis]|uniref:Uncharacterized protein n=1 Tax=Nesidiocoris tenuis TaxID=355587 RepID=A0A6H5GVR1_9HEMI|nr:unnamed protein product [Nesidiocoris tenuis]